LADFHPRHFNEEYFLMAAIDCLSDTAYISSC